MATASYSMACPACGKVGSSSRPIPPGAKVRCKCGHAFVPNPAGPVASDVGGLDLTAIAGTPDLEEEPLADLEGGLEEDRVGVEREATLTDVWKVLTSIEAAILDAGPSGPAETPVREYKVVTQKDKWFSGKFDPEKVEGALNAYAKQGWKLKGVASASVPGLVGGNRDELVIIMER